jgi:hypothetical protein
VDFAAVLRRYEHNSAKQILPNNSVPMFLQPELPQTAGLEVHKTAIGLRLFPA